MTRWLALIACVLPATCLAETVWVGRFSVTGTGLPAPWQVVQVDPEVPPTRYRLREWDGIAAVEAYAVKSMALLARPLDIDLTRTPVLCRRWRIDAPLKRAYMTTRSGDDYAARVHLSFDVPPGTLGSDTDNTGEEAHAGFADFRFVGKETRC